MMLGQCGISLDSDIGAVLALAVGMEIGKDQGFNGRSCCWFCHNE